MYYKESLSIHTNIVLHKTKLIIIFSIFTITIIIININIIVIVISRQQE